MTVWLYRAEDKIFLYEWEQYKITLASLYKNIHLIKSIFFDRKIGESGEQSSKIAEIKPK